MPSTQPPPFVIPELERLGIAPTEERLDRLSRLVALVEEGNQRANLTARCDTDEMWRRHVLDSLGLCRHLEGLDPKLRVVDIGSGAGFPGLPLAICLPDRSFTLLEATAKKTRFLEECIRELALPKVRVKNDRAETAGRDPAFRARFSVALCRAVGPLAVIAEYALPLLGEGGVLLALKGRTVKQELAGSRKAIQLLGGGPAELTPIGEGGGFLVTIRKVGNTPHRFPRPPGQAKATPLYSR
ncbi:MAG: 16S rRNA (guanine(527)-N(7))-methyltransferase RsmG [Planctomycetota bacterium]